MIYQALDKSTNEIRLLKIECEDKYWEGEQLLSCILFPVAISDGHGQLTSEKQCEFITLEGREPFKFRYEWGNYIALSYCWGTGEGDKDILLNGSLHRVTKNLWLALQAIREHLGNAIDRLMIWVDALCINQASNEERSHQVQLMRSIYIRSRFVISWLGPEDNNSDLVLDDMNELAKRYPGKDEVFHACYRGDPVFTTKFMEAFLFLATRPYWTRLWIIQEVALGDVVLLCGKRSCFWERLITVELCIGNVTHISESFFTLCKSAEENSKLNMSVLNCFRKLDSCRFYMKEHGEMDIVWLMRLGQMASVTDKRDRVYGLLGLMKPTITANILPDYTLDVRETYASFTKSLIQAEKSLEILRMAGETRGCYSKKSWIPTFDIRPWADPLTPPKVKQQACKNIPMDVDFERSDGGIGCRGVMFDVVDRLSVAHPAERLCWERTYELETVPVQPTSLFASNPEPEAAATAIWRTLTANRDVGGNVAPAEHTSLLQIDIETDHPSSLYLHEFIYENQDFMVYGRKLVDYFTIESKSKDPISHETAFRAHKCLISRKLATTRKGYLGLVPGNVQKGAIIAVLFGSSSPLIIRNMGGHYQLIGESYFHGIMDGEAVETFLKTGTGSEMFVLQ